MKRGDLVAIAVSGDHGKARPALIVQPDAFHDLLSVTVLPLTGVMRDRDLLRVSIEPSTATGLRKPSQVMIDKATTLPRAKVGKRFGRVDSVTMDAVSRALAAFLDI
ncbi:MAG: type II toxin-antitoxin system PemK/MazF family toxin [Rhodanobacteraceae bacterium]